MVHSSATCEQDSHKAEEARPSATIYASFMDETREFSFHESPTHMYDSEPNPVTLVDVEMEPTHSPQNVGKKRRWWDRVVSFRARRTAEEDNHDEDMYMRTVLESFNSSLSSNRHSSLFTRDLAAARDSAANTRVRTPPARPARRNFMDDQGAVYVAQPETPEGVDVSMSSQQTFDEDVTETDLANEADEAELRMRVLRRIQRRKAQEAMRARLLEKNQRKAQTRGKLLCFLVFVAFVVVVFFGVAIAVVKNSNGSSNSTTPTPTTPAVALNESAIVSSTKPTIGSDSSRTYASTNPSPSSSPDEAVVVKALEILSCVLMSMSLWASFVVVATHMTFKSFRLYSTPLILELSWVQAGFSLTSLLRENIDIAVLIDVTGRMLCIAESFFNYAQAAFTSAVVFIMYRSVVSYADVLVDTRNTKRRFGSYAAYVILLCVAATFATMWGYIPLRKRVTYSVQDARERCLNYMCEEILYIGSPLVAVSFNMIYYLRFKQTIGEAYPTSVSGRLNKVARSYLVLFCVCWGAVILETFIRNFGEDPQSDVMPSTALRVILLVLECIFDVLGFGTAFITLANFFRLRRAFDFGLSLKRIDPQSIEIADPLCILGEGTFAIVLKGIWHQKPGDATQVGTINVAIKTFKRTQFESLEQMKEEAYLASKLLHPCVMMTFGCYTLGNMLYIVSEYLGGGTLQDVIDANDELSYEVQLRYAHMIASGMRFLHGLSTPIIHRDLKPLNCIFDSERKRLKLADFGNSRLFCGDERDHFNSSTLGGLVPCADTTMEMTTNIGSACWAAPELLIDDERAEYSLKVDVYSFGIICWQLHTCKVPYTDIPGSVTAVADAVISGKRPSIPSACPTLFAKIMRRCWHSDPSRRPTFDEIVSLLEVEMNEDQSKVIKSLSYNSKSRASKRQAFSRREHSDKERDLDSSGTSSSYNTMGSQA